MRFYLQSSKLQDILNDSTIPNVLKERQMHELEKLASDAGITLTGNDPATKTVTADVTNSDTERLMSYLDFMNIQAVDLSPEDLVCFGGKSIETFGLWKKFRTKPQTLAEATSRDNFLESLRGIPTSELYDVCKRLLWQSITAPSEELTPAQEEEAAQELRAQGFDVPARRSIDTASPDWEPRSGPVDMTGWDGPKRPVGWAYNPQFDGPLDENFI